MTTHAEEVGLVTLDRTSVQQSAKLLLALGEARDRAQPPEKDRTFLKRDLDGSSKLVLYPSPGSYGAEWRRATKGLGLHVLPMREEVRHVQGPLHSLRREFLVAHSSGESFAMWREGFFAPGPDFPLDKALSAAQAALLGNVFRELLAIAPTGEDLADEPRQEGEARPFGPPKRTEPKEASEAPSKPPGRETVYVDPPKRPGQFHSGVSPAPVPVETAPSGALVVVAPDDLFDEKPQNNATTAPGEASSPGEKGDSSTGQASRPVEDLPAKGSVVAPSKDPMLAVVEAAPESPDGVKKIPARAFIQVQSEGEATPQPSAPQVDGRSPDQPASPSAGLFLNCVECQKGLSVSDKAFVDEDENGPYCEPCWLSRSVKSDSTARVLYPIEPNKDGFTDECPECDSVIQGVPSDDLIHDGARLFCEKGHELGVSIRDGKAHVEPVRGGPTVDIESREPAASGPSLGVVPSEGPEGQAFECDFCGKALAKKSAKTMHERACKDKSPDQRKAPVEPTGPRDPKTDPRTGDVLVFEGWTYTVQSLTPGKGRKQTRLDIRKNWTDASGAKAQDSCNWSLGAWRAFFRSRESRAATKPPEASQGSAEPQEAMPVAAGGESPDVVRQGLAPIATWKEESS